MNVQAAYTVPQLSALSGIHKNTLYSWVKSGKIPATKYGPRKILITLHAFRAAFPDVWESIRLLHQMRHATCPSCGADLND